MKSKIYLWALLFGIAISAWAEAAKEAPVTKALTEFLAVGKPSAIKISGKSTAASGALKLVDGKLAGEVEVLLDSFATGISLRDKHMKEKYLEVEKFPKAIVKIDPISLPESQPRLSLKQVPFTGTLDLHGKTQKVDGAADIERKGDEFNVNASFRIKISDYAIAVPSYAGITVTDEVNVKTTLVAALSSDTKTSGAPLAAEKKSESKGNRNGGKKQ